MSSKWLFRRWSSTSKTKEAEEEDHTLDGIPILKAPQESYTSTDDPATEAELKAVQEIQRNIDELLVGLPKEVEDDRPKFDAKRWLMEDGNILRYVRARKGDVGEAKKALKKTLEWRITYRPHAILPSDVEMESVTGKCHLNGFDKRGHPIFYLKPYLENTKALENQFKFVVFLMECCIKMMPKNVSKLTLLVDQTIINHSDLVNAPLASGFLGMMQSHYPERMYIGIILNPPTIFLVLYKIISPFIDPETKRRVAFASTSGNDYNSGSGSENGHASVKKKIKKRDMGPWVDLDDYFDLNLLEYKLGGYAKWQYIHEVYWPHIEEFYKNNCN